MISEIENDIEKLIIECCERHPAFIENSKEDINNETILIGSKWIGQVGKGNPPMIHILFVGDPDTYKSTIMKYISNVCDHCVLAGSTTVSSAGIKAIAVKMDDVTLSLREGLLPEYNGGNVFLM